MTAPDDKPSPPVEQMLGAMEKWGASDLFITAGKPPAVRLHGSVVPLEVPATPAQAIEDFLQRALGDVRKAEFEARGDLDVGFSLDDKRFRLNLAQQLGVASIVARALPSGELGFAELGLPDALGRWALEPRGLTLVTGSTGSGKSTSLAAMVHHINHSRPVHIVTIEDPVEFVHLDARSRVTQREVGSDTESYETGLRQALRESPDVILIGELRSLDSMRAALQAALTGHLVLATLHTVDVSQTLQRIISSFPDNEAHQVALDLSLSLNGIASQRLLPQRDGEGRLAAVELLDVTPAAARLIREQRINELQDLMRTSSSQSTITFDQALLRMHQQHRISFEAGRAYASQPDEFTLAVRGMSTGAASASVDEEQAAVAGLDMQGLLTMVIDQNASDLHLSVGSPPSLRVAGHLRSTDLPALSSGDLRLLLHSIMSVRQRSVYELERELDFSLGIARGRRFRVNAYFERGNMAAAFRTINSTIPDPDALGLPETVLGMADEPHGLLLVVGPTGAGKTTSLACLIDRINHQRASHIITIEDPIEYVHHSRMATVHQREVGEDTKGFGAALKYILRQDPDVVLIGELRDLETISSALTAAETGHLVLATLHTNDAVQTIDRIIDVFPPHQQSQARSQLAASLIGVISQRLLERADGKGRVAAFEILRATHAVRTLIRDNKMHQALGTMQTARASGMQTMDMALEDLVGRGLIDKEQAVRYMLNPTTLDKARPGSH